jgi:tetratricopeptide (TPR) repeat protein
LLRSARDLFEKLAVELRDDEELHDLLQWGAYYLREAGDLAAAERFQRRAVILAGKLAKGSAEPFDRLRVAVDHGKLGVILQKCGRARQAAHQFRQGLAVYEQLAAEFPDESWYRFSQASCLNFMGIALRDDADQRATALRCHQLAIPLCDRLVAEFPDGPWYRNQLVRSHFARGVVLWLSKGFAEAEQAFQQAIDAYHPPSGMSDRYGNVEQFASVHNEWAWLLATCVDAKFRDPSRAVQLARRAVELWPAHGGFTNTLGVAYYRAESWKAAIEALEKAEKLAPGKQLAWNAFFLAMAHWKLGEQEQARKEYQQAVQWMEKKHPKNEELRRFRTEAEELLKISEKKN